MSSPDKVDAQIDEGVDFFPNDDASGFTPKTNLESLYTKVIEGKIAAPNAGVRTNTKTRAAYGEVGEYAEEGNPGLSDPPHIFNNTLVQIDKFGTPWSPDFPQFTSPFMDTPLADFVSQMASDSLTLGTKTKPIRGDMTYNKEGWGTGKFYILQQPAGDSLGSGAHIPNAHNLLDSLSKLSHNTHHLNRIPSISSPEWIPGVELGKHTQPQFTSTFMDTPIAGYEADGGKLWSTKYPKTPSTTWGDGDGTMTGPVAGNPPTHELRRGVYNEYPLGANLQFGNRSDEDRIYGKPETILSGYFPSVHISKAGQFNAGVGYGAMTGQDFIEYNPDASINDVKATPWSVNFPQFQDPFLSVLANHKSRFVLKNMAGEWSINGLHPISLTWNIDDGFSSGHIPNYVNRSGDFGILAAPWPSMPTSIAESLTNFSNPSVSITQNFAVQTFTDGYSAPTVNEIGNADYVSLKNIGPFTWGDGIPSIDNILANKAGITEDNKISKDEAKSERYGGGKGFPKVPAGLGTNNKPSYKAYRSVADPDKYNHPLILRDIGDNWGLDPFPFSDNPIGEAIGGFVRGAPGITGFISRNLHDKFRIGKWMINTSDGLGFMLKQFALQALNPTLESKIWNPASALGLVGVGDAWDGIKGSFYDSRNAQSVADAAANPLQFADILGIGASALLGIGHPERHLGGLRYEDINPLKELKTDSEPGKSINRIPRIGGALLIGINKFVEDMGGLSRLAMQSTPPIIPESEVKIFGKTFKVGGTDLKMALPLMNPNRYLFPISSAPKSIHRGVPSFVIGVDQAVTDANTIQTKAGGTFNEATSDSSIEGGNNSKLVTQHSTLSYNRLGLNAAYFTGMSVPLSAGENNNQNSVPDVTMERRAEGTMVTYGVGNSGEFAGVPEVGGNDGKLGENLGVLKGNTTTGNVDRINILPVLHGETLPDLISENPDFIKFRFKDVVNNKYLVFRAILSGITDTITPEFNTVRYIGRPDNLYTYKGVFREIGFSFKIYPKTKQELPVLMEKMNYLIGLCYPSYTEGERMVTPFIELTMGDMFVNAPGLIESLAVTVEDTTTWETDEGLQFPHYISAACTFKYIGKHIPVSTGKHYDLNWLGNETNGVGDLRKGGTGKLDGTYGGATIQPARSKHNYMRTAAGYGPPLE